MDQPAETKTSGMAISSFVLGIISLVLNILTGIPAIVLGALALSDIGKSQGAKTGKGLALTGIVTGGIGTLMCPFILAALLLPAIQAAREAARRNASMNNMVQLGFAMEGYRSAKGRFPAQANYDESGKPLLSWRVHLLPYLEQQALYEQFHLDEPWDSEHNKQLLAHMPSEFKNPTLGSETETNYLVPVGPATIFSGQEGTRLEDITDGASTTILVVEADEDRAVPWTKPDDLAFDPKDPLAGLGSLRAGGVIMVIFADGNVHALSKHEDEEAVAAFFTASGGEEIELPEF